MATRSPCAGTKRYDHPHRDQDARWPFPWHDEAAWDREMLDFFRQVIALRHSQPALRRGAFEELYAQGRVYAFLRRHAGETLLVVVNAGDEAAEIRVSAGGHFSEGESLKPQFGTVTSKWSRAATGPTRSAAVWRRAFALTGDLGSAACSMV